MTYSLNHGVFATRVGDYVFFADVKRDKHICLSGKKADDVIRYVQHGATLPEATAVALIRAHLISVANANELRPLFFTQYAHGSRDVLAAEPLLRRAPLTSIKVFHHLRKARKTLSRDHISCIVERRKSFRKANAATGSEELAAQRAATYNLYQPLSSETGTCVQDAISLLGFLGHNGSVADWVFGVSAPPFAAHCWAQAGDYVLNDTVENVRRYTPLMVV